MSSEKPRIVVVEDSAVQRLFYRKMLAENYDVIEFDVGRKALLYLEGAGPDLILLDIVLPDMQGFQVFRALKKRKHLDQVPVIACTQNPLGWSRDRFLEVGFSDFLEKPFQEETLIQVVEKQLKLKFFSNP